MCRPKYSAFSLLANLWWWIAPQVACEPFVDAAVARYYQRRRSSPEIPTQVEPTQEETMKMRLQLPTLIVATLTLAPGSVSLAQFNTVLLSEDFDDLVRGDSVNERTFYQYTGTALATDPNTVPIPGVFSSTGPTGWEVDNTLDEYQGAPTTGNTGVPGAGVAEYGVDEWEGWSFVNKDFWSTVDNQRRSEFDAATGTIAVADPDEYFDLGGPGDTVNGGFYNTGLKTPAISVTPGGSYTLDFDYSWRDETFDDPHPNATFTDQNNQSAEVLAVFTDSVGSVVQTSTLDAWNSDPNDLAFRDDTTNGSSSLNFSAPRRARPI